MGKNNSFLPILLVVVLLLGGGVMLFSRTSAPPAKNVPPSSGYSIVVDTVNPGKTLSVASVQTAQAVYVEVVRDGKSQETLGKSSLLSAGFHSSVMVNLSSSLVDGDVVYIRLADTTGKVIQNDQKVDIKVLKNVGRIMTHYADEY